MVSLLKLCERIAGQSTEDDLKAHMSTQSTPTENISLDDGSEIANTDLQQLYKMLSKKIDMVRGSSTAVQAKVDIFQRQMA